MQVNYIELFAGCGGLSLGLESAGFELLLANELSPMASETFAFNHLNADLENQLNIDKVFWVSSTHTRENIHARLRENPQVASGINAHHHSDLKSSDLTGEELKRSLLIGSIVDINKIIREDTCQPLLEIFSDANGSGGVDLVSGGPPCQSFSLAGLRDHANQRNELPWEFAEFVKLVRPKIVLLENVSGILRAFKIDDKKYYAWFEVAKTFAKVGYVPLCLHVNAKYVGAAQNRPRFILIALRKDIYSKIVENCDDNSFLKILEPGKAMFDQVVGGDDPKYGCLPYYDIEKQPEIFDTGILSGLLTHKNGALISVKQAIDDLRASKIKASSYVMRINRVFENRFFHKNNKFKNHDFRLNSNKVRARFRLYQIMTKIPKSHSKEILKYLKSEGATGILSPTLHCLKAHWVLDIDGSVIAEPDEKKLLRLLSSLYTKKQTQRALHAALPAPAALSIPDDACHYYESVDTQRTLTVREMARIQSFPDWYDIKSKVTTGGQMRKFEVPQYTQIGNAVPPLLGLALGQVCRRLLNIADHKS